MNASFYRLPSESAIDGWLAATPADFRFVLKGSRLITHARRLDAPQALETFLARARRLGPKLAALLWQLPPAQERDDERLLRFIRLLPSATVQAVEFRHASWEGPDVDDLLAERGVARVAVSRPGWAFFNNDGAARAPFDAMQLEAMLGRPRRSAPPGA